MNAPTSFETTLHAAHRSAVDDANGWRGRCVNLFARGERWISEALLAAEPEHKLPMLLSQKIKRLAQLNSSEPRVSEAVQSFSAFVDLRNQLVHGDGAVFIDVKSEWLLKLDVVGRAGRSQRSISKEEAQRLYREIRSAVDVLGNRLKVRT